MDGNATRTTILDWALRLFAEHGYDGVGVQEIAASSGVTKPTLYYYFGSKRGLLEALFAERLEGLHVALAAAAQYRRDLPFTMNEIARAVFSFARANPGLYRLYLSLWFAPNKSEAYAVAVSLHARNFAVLETLFTEAARDHGNMKGRHRAYAATFLGMLNNYAALSINNFAELNDRLAYQSVHQFMHGIYA